MPQIDYSTLKEKSYKVNGIVTFTVEAEAEIPVFVDHKQEPNWSFASQAQIALIEAAKKKVEIGNCDAKVSNADIHL